MISDYCDSTPYLKNTSGEISPELMDAGIGFMNRELQTLIDYIGEQLYSLGAFCKGSLGKVCSEYANSSDFYTTMLGIQIRVYLEGTGADSKNGASLGQIVRNRNHFIYKYPKILKNCGGKVPANEFNLLRDTISAIETRSNSFEEAFQKMLKIQSKAQTVSAGKNSCTKPQADLEKIKRTIENSVPHDRTMIPLSKLTSLVQAAVPGRDPQKILGRKLKEYLENSKEYTVKETNSGPKVGRSN